MAHATSTRTVGPPFRVAVASVAVILVAVCTLVLTLEGSVETSAAMRRSIGISSYTHTAENNKLLMAAVCGATCAGLLGWVAWCTARRGFTAGRRMRAIALAVLTALLFAGSFSYFYGMRGVVLLHFPKFHDAYHYVLGAKYFPELGYFDLYDCTLVADRELGPLARGRMRIRDLRTYRYERVRQQLKRTRCPERFSEARWHAFKQDVELIRKYTGRYLFVIMRDRGYNGTPFHTAVAMPLVSAIDLSYKALSRLALIDVVLLSAMLMSVARAFGNITGLLFGLYAFTNFGDRFELIGGSYLRYGWYAAIGIGIAMLQLRRHAAAGTCLALATMLNVFPLVFFGGIGLKVGIAVLTRQPIARQHLRFLAAGAVAALIAFGASILHSGGISNYRAFERDMDLHADVVSTGRIGLRYAFMFRGEVTEDDPPVSNRQKAREFQTPAVQVSYWTLALALLAAGGFVASRLSDVAATCLFGVLAFFLLFGAVPYYYAILALLVLVWHDQAPRTRFGMTAAWFGCSLVVHAGWLITDFRPFVQSGLMTWTTGGYLLLCLAVLARARGRGLDVPAGPPARSLA